MPIKFSWHSFLVLLLGVFAVILASRNISTPGIYYDETLFANAALLGSSDIFAHWKPFGIPILLMSYIGAIKAWIYIPIFYLFGVDPLTIRLPTILFGVMGGGFLVVASIIWYGRCAGVLCAALIFFDPSLLIHSRLDWGPTALMFLFRGCAIFGIAWWWSFRTPAGIWITIAACGLGGFDKLNFIWVIMSLCLSFAIVFRNEAREYLKHYTSIALIQLGSILGIAGFIFVRALIIGNNFHQDVVSISERLAVSWHLIVLTIVGGGALDFISGDGLIPSRWMVPAFTVAFVIAIANGILCRRTFLWRPWLFLTLFTLFLTAFFMMTKAATGPHHSAVLAGMLGLLIGPLLSCRSKEVKTPWSRTAMNILRMAGAVILCYAMIYTNVYSLCKFAVPRNFNWAMAHNSLGRLFQSNPHAYFRTGDWGMGTQLIAFSKGKIKINDYYNDFSSNIKYDTSILKSLDGSPTILLVHAEGRENFKQANSSAVQSMYQSGFKFEQIDQFNDEKGVLIRAFLIQAH
jgi:hypothetical protein